MMPRNMPSQNLKEFCELMSDTALSNAEKLLHLFQDAVSPHRLDIDSEYIFKTFAFMNFTIIVGIWSNIQHTTLRQELIDELVTSVVLKLAETLSPESKATRIAAMAAFIREDLDAYLKGNDEVAKKNNYADSNTDRVFAIGRINKKYQIGDDIMCDLIPVLFSDSETNTQIESVAIQMNKAAEEYN